MKSTTPSISMDSRFTDWTSPSHCRRYSTPRCYDNIVGKPLTDKRIRFYEESGWYGSEQKEARLARAEKKLKRQTRREGSFTLNEQGRLIYNPI